MGNIRLISVSMLCAAVIFTSCGTWSNTAKGTAIGVAVGVALTSLGDYLLGDTGLIAFCIGLVKQAIAFF